MANKKISELPSAGALTGAELVEVVDGGINRQTTTQDIADLGGGGGAWGSITGTLSDQTDLQNALDGKVNDTGNETIAGVKTFSSDPIIPDESYGSGWNGSLEPPTKNAVYDKIETLLLPFIESGTVYVDANGNDGTGVLGSRYRPFQTINAALVAGVAVTNLKVIIGTGTFATPSTANLRGNLSIEGAGKPGYDATVSENPAGTYTVGTPTKLVGGTIINGEMAFVNYSNVNIQDLGIDQGSAYVAGGGTEASCLTFASSPLTLPMAQATNITIKNFTALGKDAASAHHGIVVQSVYGVMMENIDTWFSIHGVAIKASVCILNNSRHRSHGNNSIIIKSDGSTAFYNIVDNFQSIGGAVGVYLETFTGAAVGPYGNIVSNGIIVSPTADGVRAAGAGTIAYHNSFDNIKVFSAGGDGFDIASCGLVEINNCFVNAATTIGYKVRMVSGQLYGMVKNSTARACGGAGIDVDALGGTTVYVKNCHTENNTGVGITVGNAVVTSNNTHIGSTAAQGGSVGSTNQNYEVTSVFGGNAAGPAAIRLLETSTNGSNYLGLTVPASLSANLVYTLPVAPAVSGYALVSTTAGVMSWTDKTTNAYVAKTALYTLTSADYAVEVTSGTHTQTLPTAVGITGKEYIITNSGSGTVTVGTTSSQTFVNVTGTPTTLSLAQFKFVKVMSNGANWIVTSIN